MIKLVRIDERLVHGQVAVVWSKHLGVNRIIVADDEASTNEIQKLAMKMAIPDNIKLSVVSVDKAIELLSDPRAEKLNIFLVVSNPFNALKIANSIVGITQINVGNYGRMLERDLKDKITLETTFLVSKKELEGFKALIDKNIHVYYQTIPEEKKTDVEKLIKRVEK